MPNGTKTGSKESGVVIANKLEDSNDETGPIEPTLVNVNGTKTGSTESGVIIANEPEDNNNETGTIESLVNVNDTKTESTESGLVIANEPEDSNNEQMPEIPEPTRLAYMIIRACCQILLCLLLF